MRLTEILCRFKRALPGGHIWRGKYRLYKKVTPDHLHKLKLQYELEEKNMFYLRHPYITREQSRGHERALGKHKTEMQEIIANRKFKENSYLGDRFGYLKINDSWDN